MIKILIADDHSIFRRGLRQTINDYPDLQVTGEARQGSEVLDLVAKNDYDLVILDITMPGLSGLDILKQLRVIKPELPILVLSMHPEDQYGLRVLKAGGSGYLTKETGEKNLINAIRKAVKGGKHISQEMGEKLAFSFEKDFAKLPHEVLSDREYEIMCLLGLGKSVNAIAAELNLGISTVSTYRTRILEKTGLKNNAAIISYALKNKLVA